ncbi:MAG: hypothetical protein NC038_06465 [Paludibacter sp.]|nr:hypothetical protein [Bacteroidales bacterium]MCM1069543.1 hypothetical protein [Prevotella sp.]MCM1354189.1 hypothetical protein [Bacteroides sp.]MCM1443072.1 hypothetical protein [Muribaculum sp.]MCM1482263.1 hypothetical protein [Paludibacter sp.]
MIKCWYYGLFAAVAVLACGCTEIVLYPSVLTLYVPEGGVQVRTYQPVCVRENNFSYNEQLEEYAASTAPYQILGEQLYAVYGKIPADAKGNNMSFKRITGNGCYYILGEGGLYIHSEETDQNTYSSLASIQIAYDAGVFPYSCADVIEEIRKQCPKAVRVIDDYEEHEVQESILHWSEENAVPTITLPLAKDVIIPSDNPQRPICTD